MHCFREYLCLCLWWRSVPRFKSDTHEAPPPKPSPSRADLYTYLSKGIGAQVEQGVMNVEGNDSSNNCYPETINASVHSYRVESLWEKRTSPVEESSHLDTRGEKALALILKRKLHNSKFLVQHSAVRNSSFQIKNVHCLCVKCVHASAP